MKYSLIIILAILVLFGGGYLIKNNTEPNIAPNTESQNFPNENNPVINNRVEKLDLSGDGLTKAPDNIFTNTYLTELNLSNNNLSGALQAEVRYLLNLKVLNLSNNKFTGLPAEIGQLKNLEILDLSNNQLTGLPSELGNLTNLKVLNVSGNSYSEADLSVIRKSLPATTVIKTK